MPDLPFTSAVGSVPPVIADGGRTGPVAPPATPEGALVAAVFEAWRRERVDFLVLRNYEQLPEHTTNDIDVLVRPRDRRRAERLLLAAAHAQGFRLHNRAEFATLALYLSEKNSTVQVHFDLFTELTWRGFRFLDCSGFFARKVSRGLFYVPHPGDEAAVNLLAYTIYSGEVKEKYREQIAAGFAMEGRHAQELLAQSYGKRHARRLAQAAVRKNWAAIERRVWRLRGRLIFRHFNRHPLWTAWSALRTLWRLGKRWCRPPGLFVVLCGPDGCGKSTAGPSVMEKLRTTFSPAKSARFHWKPRLFNAGRSDQTPATRPHGRPPRSKAASLIYFCFHSLEFALGSWLVLPPILFRGGLVVIDRYYYDFFVDPLRYRLQVPQWLVWCAGFLVRKPDLVFLLDAPPGVLRQRKEEVAPEETARQREEFLRLVRQLPNGVVINAAHPPDHVAGEIAGCILEHLARR